MTAPVMTSPDLPPLNVVDRFDAAAAWAALHEKVRNDLGARLISGLAACALIDYAADSGDLRFQRIGFVAEAIAGDTLSISLAEISLDTLGGVLPTGEPRIPAIVGMICERCGCSEMDACSGGCAWARPNVCTACAPAGG